ncbi:MAG: exodeoxyribonuclease III [Verrucomicrobia bacterium GWF2_51_19]|nr:MAG: exodeoxyribonuclease III [Verrucomicrobia bacterium GWF2_51_19]HCJ11697.1 exodeoxyribonuclease III [Opitutae bacterium]
MKILSWNVNGLRSLQEKGFDSLLEKERADVICLQETKVYDGVVPDVASEYPHKIFHHAAKKGYSGTAIFSKVEPLSWTLGCLAEPEPTEGRVITAEFKDFYLVNVYVPNAQAELTRLPFRMRWDKEFRAYLCALKAQKGVILCGDLNVAHAEIDLVHPEANHFNAGFTDEERAGFSALLDAGFVDVFRETHPAQKGHYTWWSYRASARSRNVGWRIDYFLVSQNLIRHVSSPAIHPKILGSDHCPVSMIIQF